MNLKIKVSAKKKNKIQLKEVIKWFFIILACLILVLGIIARIYHFVTVHLK
jgi:hypothetical protein